MKTKVKVWLEVVAIVFGTIVGVHFIYDLYTHIGKERALRIGTGRAYVLRASRGIIYDAGGQILARTDTTFDIHLDCVVMASAFRDSAQRESTIEQLASCLTMVFTQKDSASWSGHSLSETSPLRGGSHLFGSPV